MATGYRPLTTDDKDYPLADPSVEAMIAAYAVEARAGFKDRVSREAAAKLMGFEPDACEPELSRPDYIVEMCRVLFPTCRDRIGEGKTVNVAEVLRASADFFAVLR
jgi:hypothetical protein